MTRRTPPRFRLLAARCLSVCVLLSVSGCPRELAIPDASGPACIENLDCNGGMTCGFLRACVLGHCEADASLPVPCEGGCPIDAGLCDAAVRDGS